MWRCDVNAYYRIGTQVARAAVELELEHGVPVFRVSEAVQEHIETLLHNQRFAGLTEAEAKELEQYEEIDDYLSYLNRLVRNLTSE